MALIAVCLVGLSLIAPGLSKGLPGRSVPVSTLSIPNKVTAQDKQEYVLLACPIVTKEDNQVIWLDNDKHLVLSGIIPSGDLQIMNVTPQDTGIYRCILNDNQGHYLTSAVELIVTSNSTTEQFENEPVRRAVTAGVSCLLFILISSTIYHLRWKPPKNSHQQLPLNSPSNSNTLQVPPFPRRSPPNPQPHPPHNRIYLLPPPPSSSSPPSLHTASTTTTSATIEMTCISGQKLYSQPREGGNSVPFLPTHPLSPPFLKTSSPPHYLASSEESSPTLHLSTSPF